jgi:antitoxin (DNA-binding transcriptional repressor) of toxin-antitoxin stability system
MKLVTASEARKNWFRLLDEVAAGEIVVVQRHGRRIVLRCESPAVESTPSYAGLIRSDEADRADSWHWKWGTEGVTPIEE